MFYYVIYNSTVLNYSNNNKNLNTFIYGTVLYILSHGLINSYDNQFARYIKSYFWVILAIDIFCIYYLHNNLEQDSNSSDIDNETNSLKNILKSFYNTKNKNIDKNKDTDKNIDDDNSNNNKPETKKKPIKEDRSDNNKKKQKEDLEDDNKQNQKDLNEPIAYSQEDDFNLPFDLQNDLPSDLSNNNLNIEIDQTSDSGSDIDLDNFESSLQN